MLKEILENNDGNIRYSQDYVLQEMNGNGKKIIILLKDAISSLEEISQINSDKKLSSILDDVLGTLEEAMMIVS